MKHVIYSLTLLLCMLSVGSCTQESEPIVTNDSTMAIEIANPDNEPQPSLYVNSFELNRVILKNVDSHKVRASRSTGYSVTVLYDKEENPACYVVNFEENCGFMIVSAVKTANPLLAFNNTGNFRPEENSPAKLWQDLTVEGVSETISLPEDSVQNAAILWLQYEKYNSLASRSEPADYDDFDTWNEDLKQKYRDSQSILNDSISKWSANNDVVISVEDTKTLQKYLSDYDIESARQSCQAFVYYRFESRWKQLSIIRIYEGFSSYSQSNFIKPKWNQYYPYNISFPLYDGWNHSAVGCGPLAIGRIMRHYEWPTSFNWGDMPLTSANKTISDFLFNIAEQCEPEYGKNTFTPPSYNERILKQYNYKNYLYKDITDKSYITAINNKLPVIITGIDASEPEERSHTWLMCGSSNLIYTENAAAYTVNLPNQIIRHWMIQSNSRSVTLYYMDWGWSDSNDGYYSIDYLSLKNYYFDRGLIWISPIPNK